MNTSLSIVNPEAAWDFVKLLISNAKQGIPLLRTVFEDLMSYNSRTYSMSPEDIDTLRYIAEKASGIVLADPARIELITGELNAYISGNMSAKAVGEQFLSRVTIYLGDQG